MSLVDYLSCACGICVEHEEGSALELLNSGLGEWFATDEMDESRLWVTSPDLMKVAVQNHFFFVFTYALDDSTRLFSRIVILSFLADPLYALLRGSDIANHHLAGIDRGS